jgi:hypothetical protein
MSARAEMCFTGEVDCPVFKPNRFKPDFCTGTRLGLRIICMQDVIVVECSLTIDKHRGEAVKDEIDIINALQFSQAGEKVSSHASI